MKHGQEGRCKNSLVFMLSIDLHINAIIIIVTRVHALKIRFFHSNCVRWFPSHAIPLDSFVYFSFVHSFHLSLSHSLSLYFFLSLSFSISLSLPLYVSSWPNCWADHASVLVIALTFDFRKQLSFSGCSQFFHFSLFRFGKFMFGYDINMHMFSAFVPLF